MEEEGDGTIEEKITSTNHLVLHSLLRLKEVQVLLSALPLFILLPFRPLENFPKVPQIRYSVSLLDSLCRIKSLSML